jgi:hypothetical protein
MKAIFFFAILSFLTLPLFGQNSFTVTVVPNQLSYAGTGQTDLDGYPMKGANFVLDGFIYRGDYFESHDCDDKNCGVSATGEAEHPSEVIGKWSFRGFTLIDVSIALASGGTPTFSNQIFAFTQDFEDCPGCTISIEGKDLYGGASNESFKKAIVGGTTDGFRLMRGEVEQMIFKQPQNENATGGYNLAATFFYQNN